MTQPIFLSETANDAVRLHQTTHHSIAKPFLLAFATKLQQLSNTMQENHCVQDNVLNYKLTAHLYVAKQLYEDMGWLGLLLKPGERDGYSDVDKQRPLINELENGYATIQEISQAGLKNLIDEIQGILFLSQEHSDGLMHPEPSAPPLPEAFFVSEPQTQSSVSEIPLAQPYTGGQFNGEHDTSIEFHELLSTHMQTDIPQGILVQNNELFPDTIPMAQAVYPMPTIHINIHTQLKNIVEQATQLSAYYHDMIQEIQPLQRLLETVVDSAQTSSEIETALQQTPVPSLKQRLELLTRYSPQSDFNRPYEQSVKSMQSVIQLQSLLEKIKAKTSSIERHISLRPEKNELKAGVNHAIGLMTNLEMQLNQYRQELEILSKRLEAPEVIASLKALIEFHIEILERQLQGFEYA